MFNSHKRFTSMDVPWCIQSFSSCWTCVCVCVCVCVKSLQSCPTLYNPKDYRLPGSSVHRILQARILEWVAVPSSRGSSRPRDRNCISYISCIGRKALYH